MTILFLSDYVCPYCLVAKEALKKALSMTGLSAEIVYHPFELTPEPRPRVDTYHDEVRKSHYQVLVKPCRQLGLDMKLPPKVVPRPYTRLAFEGWFYACDHGKGEAYNDAVYRAYFIDEQDIGQIPVLAEIAASVGLNAADFTAALEAGTYTAQEQAAVRHTREAYSPTGVPTIYIDGRKVELAEYTAAEMVQLLNDAQFQTFGGFSCGENGC